MARRSRLSTAGLLWLAAGAVYAGCEAIAARAYPGYSYARNYISDLGVPYPGVYEGRVQDSQLAGVMNFGFIAEGALMLAGTLVAVRLLTSRGVGAGLVGLAGVHAVGITLVALFPAGELSSELTLQLHVTGAGMSIVAGNLLIISAGLASRALKAPRWYAVGSVALGVTGLVSLVMLLVVSGSTSIDLLPDGVWERGAVGAITLWQIGTGVLLLVKRPGRSGSSSGTSR
ncbi:DUF998 domain-containing protein [Ornithinimicrobium sp. Arc0846-15]|nr:DUF998 domain-containing protein [Ornithinimicrobium laminariae]